eukprot:TRINITY_DN1805_c0_g2_i5.p2 TRINITY_DN1805_c0_g2~~TRINITY_DN1805_c0_g2_i5.p2  ORF type:complete len:240 (+),score=65.86 TRINITY_DN1805_c0_g2_i5:1507-2226(+)
MVIPTSQKEYNPVELPEKIRRDWLCGIEELASRGATITPVSLLHTPYALACYYVLALAEASSNLARYDGLCYGFRVSTTSTTPTTNLESMSTGPKNVGELYTLNRSIAFGDEVKNRILTGNYVLSQSAFEEYYLKASKVRRLIKQDFDNVFQKQHVHVLLTPTAIGSPPAVGCLMENPVEAYLNDVMTVSANLAGIPAITVPVNSQEEDASLLQGLQLMANHMQEQYLFKVARVLESAS